MPTDLTLAEFAERIAPCEFRAWRTMRSILSDSNRMPPKVAARIERATALLIDKYRGEYMRRYRIDEGTFLSSQRSVAPNSLPVILTFFDTPTEREKEVMWLASRDARREAMDPLLERYRRQCAPAKSILPIYTTIPRKRTLFDRLTAKLRAAMVQPGVTVTGTHSGGDHRALRRVELQKAAVNLAKDMLTVGQQAWSLVQVEIRDPVAAAGSPINQATPAANDDEVISWMITHRQTLKRDKQKHGRDVVLKAAAKWFGKPRKTMLAIWNSGRSARSSGHSKAD